MYWGQDIGLEIDAGGLLFEMNWNGLKGEVWVLSFHSIGLKPEADDMHRHSVT